MSSEDEQSVAGPSIWVRSLRPSREEALQAFEMAQRHYAERRAAHPEEYEPEPEEEPCDPGPVRLLTVRPVLLHVENHMFLAQGDDDSSGYYKDEPTTDVSNGLVDVFGSVVQFYTGIAVGHLHLQVDYRADAPQELELDEWEDVVEVSAQLTAPCTRFGSYDDNVPEEWPDVNQQGPGWYRIRAHCRGRDLDYDSAPEVPREHHRIVVWPAPQTGSILYKLNDYTGMDKRRSDAVRVSR
ncbi:hypothetical protein LWF15_07100 [Kineosporia rhizophila]|uniref:hypothetical protein n=1 Tax=Kineosporia rhizophila TaxID=84633 RepID=UPI000B29D27E|nr:hypothetical protein [Kineosporia rhizophila]MCE0535271.1 hypothetical protein [Kineosporia rhizophila]